jgi:hypothetical protein
MAPIILVALWDDGVHASHGDVRRHELAGHAVRGLARGPDGRALAIVDGDSLCRRATTLAIADRGGSLYLSTDGGGTWSVRASGLGAPSSVLVL